MGKYSSLLKYERKRQQIPRHQSYNSIMKLNMYEFQRTPFIQSYSPTGFTSKNLDLAPSTNANIRSWSLCEDRALIWKTRTEKTVHKTTWEHTKITKNCSGSSMVFHDLTLESGGTSVALTISLVVFTYCGLRLSDLQQWWFVSIIGVLSMTGYIEGCNNTLRQTTTYIALQIEKLLAPDWILNG